MEEKAHSKKLTSRSKQSKPQQQERITRSERQRRADNVVVIPEPTDMEVSKQKADDEDIEALLLQEAV
jgi:hypothetical protein